MCVITSQITITHAIVVNGPLGRMDKLVFFYSLDGGRVTVLLLARCRCQRTAGAWDGSKWTSELSHRWWRRAQYDVTALWRHQVRQTKVYNSKPCVRRLELNRCNFSCKRCSQGRRFRLRSDYSVCTRIFTPATLCVERVFATATCPSVLLSVCYSGYCIKTERASVMISSPSHSPMISFSGEVWLVEKFARGHPERGRFVRLG